MSDRILTISEVHQLAELVKMAQTNARIAWIDEDVSHETRTGTARSIGDENGNFLNGRDDVRDAHFRITTSNGFELFMPVAKAMALIAKSYMVIDS